MRLSETYLTEMWGVSEPCVIWPGTALIWWYANKKDPPKGGKSEIKKLNHAKTWTGTSQWRRSKWTVSTGWINTLWCIHTIEHCATMSQIKKKRMRICNVQCATSHINLTKVMLSKRRQTQKHVYFMIPFI